MVLTCEKVKILDSSDPISLFSPLNIHTLSFLGSAFTEKCFSDKNVILLVLKHYYIYPLLLLLF